jgi:hypothetical protein
MAGAAGHGVPHSLVSVLQPFRDVFTAPTWEHVLVLVMGAILVPGRRTVASALRVMGLDQARHFTNYHRVLNRNAWSAHGLSRRLLVRLVDAFVPDGEPVVIGLDDSIERRWGVRIKKRGIYRDPVRSSKGHLVKVSGLRWLSFALLPEIRWAGRCWALPFLTILAPSQRYWETHKEGKRRFKTLTDWARQGLLQTAHWLPHRRIVAVGDASFAALELLETVRHRVTMVTRLRLDAALRDPPPPRRPGQRGRSRLVGTRQPTLQQYLDNPQTLWRRLRVTGWYGHSEKTLEVVSGTAIWAKPGHRVAIRYVLVRDPTGEREPQAFLCSDPEVEPLDILRWFVRRWSIEVTFARSAVTLASRPSGSGRTWPLTAPRRSSSACSPWSRSGPTNCTPRGHRRCGLQAGTGNRYQPSAMRSPASATCSGRRAITAGHGSHQTPQQCRPPRSTR